MKACPVCGGGRFIKVRLFSIRSRYDGKDYPIYKCASCGLARPVPLPYTESSKYDIYDEEGITKCYDPKAKKIDFGSKEYKDYFKNFGGYRAYVEKFGIRGRHLDVGCGSGHLMSMLRGMGLASEGVELNAGIMRCMREAGFTVHDREICDPYYADGSYDLVTLNHVMEHIDDLHKFTGCLNRIVRDGGWLIFAVPYIHGLMPSLLRSHWYGHGSGQHLNFFSKESAKVLLKRHGFDVMDIKVESMDYAPLSLPEFARSAIDAACRAIALMGMGDNMFVAARKTGAPGGVK